MAKRGLDRIVILSSAGDQSDGDEDVTNRRRTILAFMAVFVVLPATANASLICDRLRDRLSAQPHTISTNNAEVRSYSSAIVRQSFEIRKTTQDMRRLNCGNSSIVTFGPNGNSQCDSLSTALDRMKQNKQILENKRDALRTGGLSSDARERLRRAMDENGCEALANPSIEQPMPQQQAAAPAGELTIPDDAMRDSLAISGWRESLSSRGGTLRTMCVRTCDGAFFPISSAATPASFGRDTGLCQNMCPGTQTELFYHSLLSQESADMVSAATGRPYRELANAFAYLHRKPGENKNCSCNLTAYYEKARSAAARSLRESPDPHSSITSIRTLPPKPVTIDPQERPYDPAKDQVRRVGPVFLPQETSSIDLKHPATAGPQPQQQ